MDLAKNSPLRSKKDFSNEFAKKKGFFCSTKYFGIKNSIKNRIIFYYKIVLVCIFIPLIIKM